MIATFKTKNTQVKDGRGWWDRSNGEEGGVLFVVVDGGSLVLADFDGAFELPGYIKAELREAGVDLRGDH